MRSLRLLSILFFVATPVFAAPPFEVSWSPLEIRQGDVIAVKVRTKSYAAIRGDFGGTPIFFYNEGDGVYLGIAGVDLSTPPGKKLLQVIFQDGSGRTTAKAFTVDILPGGFPVQRLTLPREMVELKGEALRRVLQDNRRMLAIFAAVREERLWEGGFVKPTDGKLTGAFGLRRVINGQERSPHSGVDIGAPTGAEVRACNSGIVVLCDELYLCGRTIIIDHGLGLYSMYFHLSEIFVKEGDRVGVGEKIGLVGSSGRVTAPHLHWGIRLQGARVDPFSLLRAMSAER